MIKKINDFTEENIDDLYLGQILSYVNRHFSKFVDKKLSEYDLTRSQAYFLLTLTRKDHISQEELCSELNMSEGTVARSMKRIEDKGLITREINPKDKRKKIIIITEKGRNKVTKIVKNNKEIEERITESLSKEEIDSLKYNLVKLIQLIN